MNRLCRKSLACIDTKIYCTLFALICINKIFSLAVDSRVNMMSITSYVRSDGCSWAWGIGTLVAGITARGTAAFPACSISFCTMSFCLIFRLPSQILAFIRGLPDFFVFCFNRLPSVSINFYLSFCEKNLVLPFPSLVECQFQLIIEIKIHELYKLLSCFLVLFHWLCCYLVYICWCLNLFLSPPCK